MKTLDNFGAGFRKHLRVLIVVKMGSALIHHKRNATGLIAAGFITGVFLFLFPENELSVLLGKM